jgi:hypothetical protein
MNQSEGRENENESHGPTCLVFRCRRCSACVTEAHDDCEVAIRRIVESGSPLVVHTYKTDKALGLCELIGSTAPGWFQGKTARSA